MNTASGPPGSGRISTQPGQDCVACQDRRWLDCDKIRRGTGPTTPCTNCAIAGSTSCVPSMLSMHTRLHMMAKERQNQGLTVLLPNPKDRAGSGASNWPQAQDPNYQQSYNMQAPPLPANIDQRNPFAALQALGPMTSRPIAVPKTLHRNSTQTPVSHVSGSSEVIKTIHVPGRMMGRVIGRGGSKIAALRNDTGCAIRAIEGPTPESDATFRLIGTQTAVAQAENMISEVAQFHSDASAQRSASSVPYARSQPRYDERPQSSTPSASLAGSDERPASSLPQLSRMLQSLPEGFKLHPNQELTATVEHEGLKWGVTFKNQGSSDMPIGYRDSEGGRSSQGPPQKKRQMQSINQSSGETKARFASPRPPVSAKAPSPVHQSQLQQGVRDHEAPMQDVDVGFLERVNRRKKLSSEEAAKDAYADMMDGLDQELLDLRERRHEAEKRRQDALNIGLLANSATEAHPGLDNTGRLDLSKKRNRRKQEDEEEDE